MVFPSQVDIKKVMQDITLWQTFTQKNLLTFTKGKTMHADV